MSSKKVCLGVISGKGGTGKTTISISLAIALAKAGYSVGLLDVDLTGPNITDVFGNKQLKVEEDHLIPAIANIPNLIYVSLGQIASEGDPDLWSGKYLRDASKQLLERTIWGDIKYLVVDFPPGTGNETQSLLPLMNFVTIVTVPSVLAESNVVRIIEMCKETQTPIIGLVKNMTVFECPYCGGNTHIFPEDHSFEHLGIPTIAEFALNPNVAKDKHIQEFPLKPFFKGMKNPVRLIKDGKSLTRKLIERYLNVPKNP